MGCVLVCSNNLVGDPDLVVLASDIHFVLSPACESDQVDVIYDTFLVPDPDGWQRVCQIVRDVFGTRNS